MLCVSMLALCLSATAVTALVPPPGVDDGVGAAARVSGATLAAARAEAVAHVEKLATRLDGVRVPGLRQVRRLFCRGQPYVACTHARPRVAVLWRRCSTTRTGALREAAACVLQHPGLVL